MRIKSLELIGFKSFYDKTRIELSNGINAVVGPNGCGKSNIIDAIKWVLGEQNPRMLRAGSMDELISNGTEMLKPYGMTEVSMVVNNLPSLSFDEVNIKRRLYRSGESEYYINGVKSRLKDITELFLDTGAGARSYSIIGQGKVEELITAKPEEKRKLIEEVAGVVKYKTRRKETQSRIESTRENLSRVSDMRSEVLRQMESLSRQAEEAEKYKKLTEKLKTLEIKILNAKSSGLEAEKESLLHKKSELDREISRFQEQKEIKTKVLNEAEFKSSDIDESMDEIEGEIYSVKSQIGEKKSFVEYVGKEEISIDEFINRLKKEITSLQNEINQIKENINKKKTDLQQSKSENRNIESQLNSKVRELEELKIESVNNKTELEQTKKILFEVLNNYSSVKGSAAGISKELEELTLRRQRAEKDKAGLAEINNQLASKLHNLENNLDNLKNGKVSLESDKSECSEIYTSKKNSYNELTESTSSIKEKINEVSSKIDALKSIQANYDWLPEVTRDFILNNKFDGVIGIISDFVTVSKQHEKALEAALGEKLNWIVVKNSNEAIVAIDKLRTSCKGRSTFMPLQDEYFCNTSSSSYNEYPKIADLITVRGINPKLIESMLDGIFVVPTLKEAIKAKARSNFSASYATLEGDFIDTSGAITGGFSAGGVFERKREIGELEENSNRLKNELENKSVELNRLSGEIKSLENKISGLDSLLKENEIKIIKLDNDISNVTSSIKENEKKILKIIHEIAEINDLINDRKDSVLQYDNTLKGLEKEKEEFDLRFNKFEEIVRNYEHRERLIEQDITGLKVKSAAIAEMQKSIHREVTDLTERIQRITLKINQEKDEIKLKNKEKETLINKGKATEEEVVGLGEKFRFVEKKLFDIKEQKQKSKEDLNTNRQSLIDIDQELMKLREQASSYDVKLNSINIELDHTRKETQKVFGERGLREEPVYVKPDEDFNLDESTAKYNRLKKRVDSYGLVNLLAPEEYKKLEERHNFLTEQTEDLENALDLLEKAINKLDRESITRFKEAFELINDKFKEIVSKLLKGGEGKLMITEPDSLLQTGIEAMVRSSGKRFQPMNLLSGGEKALSAIALIMSACLVRPVPFLLLDEVDAPLDESNTVKFSKLIKEIAKNSQVVLITHNKTTMVEVDTLIGITASKSVASKVVSAELNAA